MDSEEIEKYLVVVQSCLSVVGFIGNITACVVILASRSMCTLTDFYLLSLSTSDLLILITGVCFSDIYHYINRNTDMQYLYNSKMAWYINEWICETSVSASILIVTTFTVERYLAICHPFLVQSMAETSRFKKIITAIWLIAAVLALLPIVQHVFAKEHFTDDTILQSVIFDTLPYLLYTRVIVYFALPMSLIIVMYILIGTKLFERQTVSRADHTNTKALSMFAVIVVLFVISWAPYYACMLIWFHQLSPNARFYAIIVRRITYPISQAFNPVIYAIMSRRFREAFKALSSKSQKKLIDWTSIFTSTQTNEVSLEMTVQ